MTNYEKIKMLCVKKGVSERFLSTKCGVSPTYIKTYRLSEKDLPRHILSAVAEILGTTVEYLTDETDDPSIPGGSSSFYLSEREKELILAYRSNPAMQEAVDKLLGVQNLAPTIAEDIAATVSAVLSKTTVKK